MRGCTTTVFGAAAESNAYSVVMRPGSEALLPSAGALDSACLDARHAVFG